MGMFSWITQDTNESILNNRYDKTSEAYMFDDKGNMYHEPCYAGYGVFGGKDFFVLLAEMNRDYAEKVGLSLSEDDEDESNRDIGCILYSKHRESALRYPNLTRSSEWEWVNKCPRRCPNQGFYSATAEDLANDVDDD